MLLALALLLGIAVAEEPEVDLSAAEVVAVLKAIDIRAIELRDDGEYQAAEAEYDEYLRIVLQAKGPRDPEVANAQISIARMRQLKGDFKGAAGLFKDAVALAEEVDPGGKTLATALDNYGSFLAGAGKSDEAHENLVRALKLRENALEPDEKYIGVSLNNIGQFLDHQGRPREARAYLERAAVVRERVHGPDHHYLAITLVSLAGNLRNLGELDRAQQLFTRAIRILEKLGPAHPELAAALNNLSLLHKIKGDYETARALQERALDILEQTLGPDHPGVGSVLANIGSLHKQQGDLAGALPRFERAIAIKEAALGPEHPQVALLLAKLANITHRIGDENGAVPLYERSIAIYERVGGTDNPGLAMPLHDLATVLKANGRLEEASEHLKRATDLIVKHRGPEHSDLIPILMTRADFLAEDDDLEGARDAAAQAVILADVPNDSNRRWLVRALVRVAETERATGRMDASRDSSARALAITREQVRYQLLTLSERQQLALLRKERAILTEYLASHLQHAPNAEVYDAILAWKGASRRISIARREQVTSSRDPERHAIAEELKDLRSQISGLALATHEPENAQEVRDRIAEMSDRKEELERQLPQTVDARRALDVTAEAICAALPERTALVDYQRFANQYFAFVIRPNCAIDLASLGKADAVDQAVVRFRNLLAEKAVNTRIDRAGVVVRELVWDTFQPVLEGVDRILVVPDGALSTLPIGALVEPDGRFVMEGHEIAYLEDAADLVRWKQSATDTGVGALLVGGVDYESAAAPTEGLVSSRRVAPCLAGDIPPLPATRDEVTTIAALMDKRRVDTLVLTDDAPSEDTLAEAVRGKRVLHLATHGFFASGECRSALGGGTEDTAFGTKDVLGYNPMVLSGVMLAGSGADRDPLVENDGIWTAEEIANLDLAGTELVVLSACETGLGEVASGEGVLGLRRGFSIAGARVMIMSLWAIPDEETRDLMTRMYELMYRKRRALGPVDALRAAQLEAIESARADGDVAPREWAAFIASGSF